MVTALEIDVRKAFTLVFALGSAVVAITESSRASTTASSTRPAAPRS